MESENDVVRVVRYVIPPGETAPMHSHRAQVNVFFTDGDLQVTAQDGSTTDIQPEAGTDAGPVRRSTRS